MASATAPSKRVARRSRPSLIVRLFKAVVVLVAALYFFWISALIALRFIDPPTTGVQVQRRVESWFAKGAYRKRQTFVPLWKISPDLQHAVISAEDGRFYQHWGFEWSQMQKVMVESQETGQISRGASTITQQLVKNLFFTTHRNPLRKGFEYTLTPLAELILGKRRILELYLNVAEWGPGVWGAEAAAQYHYKTSAAKVDREQAARLAACLPSPRRRKPSFMNDYSAAIQDRMRQVGW